MTRKEFEDAVVDARPALLRRAKKWVGITDADDLVQQSYCTMLSHGGWEEIKNPQNWALGVIDGVGRNWRRKQQIESRAQVSVVGSGDAWIIDRQVEALRAEDGDIVDRMIEEEGISEKIAQIMDAIEGAGLTSSEDYVVLARMRGREYDEIAELLGIGRESAVTYYSNAICKVRSKINSDS